MNVEEKNVMTKIRKRNWADSSDEGAKIRLARSINEQIFRENSLSLSVGG